MNPSRFVEAKSESYRSPAGIITIIPTPSSKPASPVTNKQSAHAVWIYATLLLLILLFYFALSIWYRWLRPDPQFLSFTSGIAGLIGLSSLLSLQTRWGTQVAKLAVEALGLSSWIEKPWKLTLLVLTVTVLLGILLYIGTSHASDLFNRRGTYAFEAGQYSKAVRLFRQAISLSNDNSRAHFNLGNTYELLRDYEQAEVEYQIALELDDTFWPAYNNLGRLYLVAYGDPNSALAVLLGGQDYVTNEQSQAVLQKNMGWAYLDKGLYRSAINLLLDAVERFEQLSEQDPDTNVTAYLAETHRLLALAYEKSEQLEAEKQAWSDSLGYSLAVTGSPACTKPGDIRRTFDCANTQLWANEAQEHLDQIHE